MVDATSSQSNDYLYIKFYGPYADDGRVDMAKAAKTLLAMDRWSKRYKKNFLKPQEDFILRAGRIEPNCTEIQIYAEFVKSLSHTAGTMVGPAIATHVVFANLGLKEFFSKFMGTLGEQMALKIFSKGNEIYEKRRFIKDNEAKVELETTTGDTKVTSLTSWEIYQDAGQQLNGICNLEEGKEEKLSFGFHDGHKGTDKEVAKITYKDKDAFQDITDPDLLARRMNEPFDEKEATEVKIVGKFIDFYGLAHRYHFSFQARKEQDVYGKQKILCVVDRDEISTMIDLLKPEIKSNICIKGMATKDREGKIDKIRIDWANTDPDYNPNQLSLD